MSIDTAFIALVRNRLGEEETRGVNEITSGALSPEAYRYAVGHLNGVRLALRMMDDAIADIQKN